MGNLNLPATLLLGAMLGGGQLLAFSQLRGLTLVEWAGCVAGTCLVSVWLTLFGAGLVTLAGGGRNTWRTRWGWALLLAIGSGSLWNWFSHAWLQRHLADALELIWWNARADARGMRDQLWILGLTGGLYAIGVPWIVSRLVHWSERNPRLTPALALPVWGRLLLVVGVAAGAEQWLARTVMSRAGYQQRADLLWQSWLLRARPLEPLPGTFVLHQPEVRQLPPEPEVRAVLAGLSPRGVKDAPPIFVFIVDSLRRDMVNEQVAPNLHRFRSRCVEPDHFLASANCSHISWSALVHGASPLLWKAVQGPVPGPGAVPLRMLKQAGYQLHVLSNPDLDYFGFGPAAFGAGGCLLDSYCDQNSLPELPGGANSGDIDGALMRRLLGQLAGQTGPPRSVFLCFFDAPHHDYQWPADQPAPFQPYSRSSPLRPHAYGPENIHLLRNRYQNAVHYFDTLFGEFMAALDRTGWGEDALIVVTGDHGEEFLEHGHLVHATALNETQLRVPLLLQLPRSVRDQPRFQRPGPIASHMDVLPTLLDVVGLGAAADRLLGGRSLFGPQPPSSALAAQASAETPELVLVDCGTEKTLLRLEGVREGGGRVSVRRVVAVGLLDGDFHSLVRATWMPDPPVVPVHPNFAPGVERLIAQRVERPPAAPGMALMLPWRRPAVEAGDPTRN